MNFKPEKVTEEQINNWLLSHPERIRPSLVCKDGFKMSVQASENHYCAPRTDTGPWERVEVGFPNRIEPLLWDYAEEPGNWTDTVYGRVPVALIAAIVEVHGGFKE